jgi:hypothetical protein
MPKLPYLPLFTGDYLKDPKLSMCSPATRGIWIDLLCAMHELGRSGQVTGTLEQLARISRSTSADVASAIRELDASGAADVFERNGIFTLVNRRMKRTQEVRVLTKNRVERFRNKPPDLKNKSECNASVTANTEYEYENDLGNKGSSDGRGAGEGRNIPSIDEVISFGQNIEMSEEDCRSFFHYFQSQGWMKSNGLMVTDWKSRIQSWKLEAARRGSKQSNTSSGLSINSPAQADSMIREYEFAIQKIRDDSRNFIELDGPPFKKIKEEALKLINSYKQKIEDVRKIKLGPVMAK